MTKAEKILEGFLKNDQPIHNWEQPICDPCGQVVSHKNRKQCLVCYEDADRGTKGHAKDCALILARRYFKNRRKP